MRITVVKSVLEDLDHECFQAPACKFFRVHAHCNDRIHVVTSDTRYKLHCKQTLSGELPVNFWHFNTRDAGYPHIPCKPLGIHSVTGEVQFLFNLYREVVHQGNRIVDSEIRSPFLNPLGKGSEENNILFDSLLNVRALNL